MAGPASVDHGEDFLRTFAEVSSLSFWRERYAPDRIRLPEHLLPARSAPHSSKKHPFLPQKCRKCAQKQFLLHHFLCIDS